MFNPVDGGSTDNFCVHLLGLDSRITGFDDEEEGIGIGAARLNGSTSVEAWESDGDFRYLDEPGIAHLLIFEVEGDSTGLGGAHLPISGLVSVWCDDIGCSRFRKLSK